jgi:nucleoside-diphosphate-sugar epimerase
VKISIIGLGWLGGPLYEHLAKNLHDVWGTYQHRASVHPQSFPLVLPSSSLLTQNLAPIQESKVIIGLISPRKTNSLKDCYHQLLDSIPLKAHRVLLASSTSVYGQDQETVDDDTPAAPTTESGIKMLDFENALLKEFSHVHFLRLAGLIGKDRHPIMSMAGSKRTGGSSPINLISLIDAIRAIEFLATTTHEIPRTINIASPYHPLKKDFYNRAAHRLGLKPVDFESTDKDSKRIVHSTFLKKQGFQFFDPQCQNAP